MQTRKIELESECDGLKLAGVLVSPDEPPKGILQISHGMAEHKERYADFQSYLAERGWASVIHDHRGHGASVRSAADLGYFYEDGAEAVTEDLHRFTREAKSLCPGVPLVLFGHSMGSMIVRNYAKKYDSELAGLIVCGCPSKNAFAGLGVFFAGVVGAFRGDKYRSGWLNNLAFGSFGKRFEGESPNRWICANPETVRAYDGDDLCGFVFTANGFQNLFRIMRNCYSPKGWRVANPELPVLFISGEDDPCLIDKKHFERAVSFFRARGYADVRSMLYKGMRHEILNERENERVYADVLAFAEECAEKAL